MPDRPFFDPTPEAVQRFVRSVPLYARDDDPAFWPDERFVERRDTLLRRQVGWIAAGSPHYQKRFAELGLEPGDIRTVADLRQLPVTTKQDLMEDSSAFRLELPDRGVYDTTYFTLRTTGTTSGRPTTYEYTTHDYFGWLLSTRRLYKMHCFLPGELHFAAYPVSPMPHVSSIQAALCAGGGGAFYAGLGGAPYGEFAIHNSTEYVIDEIVRLRPQILSGVGSFLRRLLRDAAEQGRDLSTLVALTPAAEVFTAAMLEEVRANAARCGAARPIIAAPYSFTEAGLSWGQGYEGARLQCTSPDQVYLEVLDEDTLAPVADGQPGLLAVTHLNRRGMPLLRYLVGDRGAITNERCERTGRVGQALLRSSGSAHVTRSGDICKIKGTLVNPGVIHDVVMGTPGVIEYQAVVAHRDPEDELSQDRFVVRVAVEWSDAEGARQALARRVKDATEVTPEIELVDDPNEIYDQRKDFKARRFVDARRNH